MKIGERELSQEELQRVKVRIQVETLLDNEVIDSAVKDSCDQVYICTGTDNGMDLCISQTMVCSDTFLMTVVDTLCTENPGTLFFVLQKLQAKMCAEQQEKRAVQ